MKKHTLLLGIELMLSFSVFSQNWVEFSPSESTKPAITTSISNDTLVKFNVTIPGVFDTPVDTFNRIEIQGHSKMDSVGFPEVPIVSFLVAIPDCDSVNLDIELLDSIQFSDYKIYPAPDLIPDTIAGGGVALVEEFAYDTTVYNTDAMFPGYLGEAIDKGAIRSQNVIRVVLYPIQFNPIKNLLKAYSDFKISLTFNNQSGSINNNVGIFNEVAGNTLINYNSNGLNASVNCGAGLEVAGSIKWVTSFPNDYVEDSCDYLIITHNNFYTNLDTKSEIESLAQHRADFNGFNVVMTTTNAIYSAFPDSLDMENDEEIKELIKNTYENGSAYHTYDGKIAYVNLFGDVDLWNGQENIPTHYEDPDHGGYDVYFTRLTYDSIAGEYDIYPDLMIGHCSADDTTQIKNVAHKIKKLTNIS